MAFKTVELPNIGNVILQKRRGTRSLRISISASGQVKVTMPTWSPYKLGHDFVMSKQSWILKHRPNTQLLTSGLLVGKAHHFEFLVNDRLTIPRTKVTGNTIIISTPTGEPIDSIKVQELARKAAIKALKHEAQQLLPQRLDQMASEYGFEYKSVQIKRLSSRWGSCDQQANISLNCYLMILPWKLIDYVLLHELTHTRVMSHGPKFWSELSKYVPKLAEVRKEIRKHRPSLNSF
jgi:predicted metal-dependent hydrolase